MHILPLRVKIILRVTTNKHDWYVNEECIVCDACVLVAEKHFKIDEAGERAYVHCQPKNSEEEALCEEAMEACPVEAIKKKEV